MSINYINSVGSRWQMHMQIGKNLKGFKEEIPLCLGNNYICGSGSAN
jgi:hypothetical protein